MGKDRLLHEIERLRAEMERRAREAPLNSSGLLRLSERLDRMINAYHNRGRKQDAEVGKRCKEIDDKRI